MTDHYLMLGAAVGAFAQEIAAGGQTLPFDTGEVAATLVWEQNTHRVLLVGVETNTEVQLSMVLGSRALPLEPHAAPSSTGLPLGLKWFAMVCTEPIDEGALLRLRTDDVEN